MKKTALLLLSAILAPLAGKAQTVWMNVGENTVPLKAEQTQTERKPGWKIVDIQMKDKLVRYLWGRHATQLADSARPTLFIYPDEKETLTDYVLINLKQRKQYRQLRKPVLAQNEYIRFVPEHFDIVPAAGIGFACIPKQPLPEGEYIVTHLTQKTIGEFGDYTVYTFSVRKE